MTMAYRLTLTAMVIVGSILFVLLFSFVGSSSRGPLQDSLDRISLGVSSVENWMVMKYRGPGRSARLSWFEAYRENLELLREPETILTGAFDNQIPRTLQGIVELEESLDTTLPIIHFYTAWGDKSDQRFPHKLVNAIWDLGSVPATTWEPWLTDFEENLHVQLPPREERDKGGLASIARGDYDFYIDDWAKETSEFGRPIFIRFGHEMNDPYRYPWGPQNNKPEDFIAAWKRVVGRFRSAGADNVIWVWSPHPAYEYAEYFYPGDEYVDWVGAGVLNYGTAAHWSQWWTFQEIFGNYYPELAGFGKPIMLTELATLAVGGDPALWYSEALTDLDVLYPAVKSILFFHSSSDATVTYKTLSWSFFGDSTITSAITESIESWVD